MPACAIGINGKNQGCAQRSRFPPKCLGCGFGGDSLVTESRRSFGGLTFRTRDEAMSEPRRSKALWDSVDVGMPGGTPAVIIPRPRVRRHANGGPDLYRAGTIVQGVLRSIRFKRPVRTRPGPTS